MWEEARQKWILYGYYTDRTRHGIHCEETEERAQHTSEVFNSDYPHTTIFSPLRKLPPNTPPLWHDQPV